MTLLFGALAAALAALTALHLRSRPRGGATPFPSFQHLEGLAPRRRPAFPLEEPLRWALRALALCLAAAALFLSRRDAHRPLVILVEPGSPMWRPVLETVRAAKTEAVALTFEGGRPLVESTTKALDAGERARRTLASCSAAFQACLVRAAHGVAGDAVVVSSFREPAGTFSALGTFRYVRSEAPSKPATAGDPGIEPQKAGHTRVVRTGKGPAARVWGAALETVEGEMGNGETEIAVVDRAEDADPARFTLVPIVASCAAARPAKVGSVALGEDATLAAGAPALALESSLALETDASLRSVVAPVLARRGKAILIAATEDDLGSWAHASTLRALARIVLFESGRGLRVSEVTAGSHQWSAAPSAKRAPVGILDVAPGRFERDDRRVVLDVSRASAIPGAPTDADVTAAGGRRLDALPPANAPSPWPVILLVAALALRLVDVPARGSSAWLLFSLVVLALFLLTIDGSVVRKVALPPEEPRAVILPAGRPSVTLASWEMPAEVRVGEAALLHATLLVAGGKGRDVTLSVRPTSGPVADVARRVSESPEAVTLSIPVSAATEGVSFALVRARIGDGDGDSLVVPLATRAGIARRVVLAAAPTWEARAAGEALAKSGEVQRITRLGSKAILSRGTPPRDPIDFLGGDLSKMDLIVLCGFTREELAGAPEAALSRWIRSGGAALFVGGLPRLASIPLPAPGEAPLAESSLPSRVTGTLGGRTLAFPGFPAWKTTLPAAAAVLGRLDGAPWIVGRAVGLGRVGAVAAPDAWRAGAPGSSASYESLLADVVAWLEAGRASVPIVLSPDLRGLGTGGAWNSLPAASVAGLPVDPLDPFSLLPPGLGKERVLARRAGEPLVTAGSEEELASARARIPVPAPLPRRIFARDLDAIWLALCALLVAEVALRRRAA